MMAAPTCPLLGDGITDDTLLNIARFLPTAKDLLCLKLTNSRFAAKIIAAAPSGGSGRAVPEMLCIADEAERLFGGVQRARRSVGGCRVARMRACWV